MATAAAAPRLRASGSAVRGELVRALTVVLVLAVLWGLWEAYRATWQHFGFTRPFAVDRTTMPHIHEMVSTLFEPSRVNGPLLIDVLGHAALFTAKEAAVGFVIGATVGFALGVVLAHSRLLSRGLMPYVVASQTIPILAIAPMVVVGLGNLSILGWTPSDWQRVSVIAAYLSFFPVTINTVRGLNSADPRAVELMRSYAAGTWRILWKLRFPASLPYLFTALKIAATACVVGAIVGELPSSIQAGLGGQILNFNQYYTLEPEKLWATNIVAAALGIVFFVAIVIAEKLVVRRAPERAA